MFSKIQYISKGNTSAQHLDHIRTALDGGVNWIQLRMKNGTEREICSTGWQVARLCADYKATFILNDYLDWVHEVGADGVHLGLNDCGIKRARVALGNQAIIGGTANSFADVCQRMEAGCDYIGLGPFRYTSTKAKLSPILGLAGYQQIFTQLAASGKLSVATAAKGCPVYAIGGIGLEDLPALMTTGVFGVALSGYLTLPQTQEFTSKAGTLRSAQNHLKEKIYQLKKLLYV